MEISQNFVAFSEYMNFTYFVFVMKTEILFKIFLPLWLSKWRLISQSRYEQNKFSFPFIFLTDNNASSGPDSQNIQDSTPKYYSDFFATELAMPEWEAWATIISLSLVIIGVVHQIVSPISNSESTIFLTNIYYDFFFNWQTEKKKKRILDQ